MYALEYKQLYIPREALTKNRTCQSYRWKQYAVCEEREPLEQIKAICGQVFEGKKITYCYLFGSYAKGKARECSDVDLLVSTPISGMQFYDLVEELREKLCKQVDVLNQEQLRDNLPLVEEILRDGVKIYG